MTVTERSSVEEIGDELAAVAAASGGAVVLELSEPRTQFHIHANEDQLQRVGERLRISVPAKPNTWTGSDPALVWMGPGECLLVSDRAADDLGAGVAETAAAVVDVSSARLAFTVAGDGARELLARGSSIDLHPTVFGAGRSALTLYEGVGIVLMATTPEPAFRVLVRRSFCVYLAGLLIDAARELEV